MRNVLSLIIMLILVTIIYAQDDVIKDLQKKFNSIETLNADFFQSTKFSQSKSPVTSKGKIYYQKNDKYRIEFKNSTLVSDGASVWNYNAKQNKVVISSLNGEKGAFSIKNFLVEFPENATVESAGSNKLNGKDYKTVNLKSKNNGQFKAVKIWYDSDNMVKKIETSDNGGTTYSFELNNIKIDQNLTGEKFTFETPKGAEVIDLR